MGIYSEVSLFPLPPQLWLRHGTLSHLPSLLATLCSGHLFSWVPLEMRIVSPAQLKPLDQHLTALMRKSKHTEKFLHDHELALPISPARPHFSFLASFTPYIPSIYKLPSVSWILFCFVLSFSGLCKCCSFCLQYLPHSTLLQAFTHAVSLNRRNLPQYPHQITTAFLILGSQIIMPVPAWHTHPMLLY